ncbi:hypothetical protein FB567DRAFT_520420 [Paraphoma chrysanthemicola]|uniref:Uncharacterized protein n=1 Tax=Paraphoma chrysanthemicola TaxID=798071 RepID=A0A8K0RB93_9PLEO|nr:hypothetical protein FB567DRAFT_520420 [Paraphoma chrysanthemicola]
MELTALTLINVQTLLISISVVALSILNFCFVGHALLTFAAYFPARSYVWQNPGQPWTPPTGREHRVQLGYDYSPENMILVSTAFSILAGLFGIAGFWIAKNSPKLSTLWSASTLSASTAAFVASFVSIIVSSVKYEKLAHSTCSWSAGRYTNSRLTCTRELVACELVNFITDTNWADNRRACRETKGARVTLVPLTVLTFVLVVLYALRIHMLRTVKSVDESAEERVERLQGEE